MTIEYVKLEIFIPETHFPQLQKALQSVDAGHIGNYWRPLAGTHPYIGKQDEISCEAELKVEVTILAEKLMETVAAVKAVHPYEEPVINVIPLIGIGI